jgi:hypothetical protein
MKNAMLSAFYILSNTMGIRNIYVLIVIGFDTVDKACYTFSILEFLTPFEAIWSR